jgi:hypothetical protein
MDTTIITHSRDDPSRLIESGVMEPQCVPATCDSVTVNKNYSRTIHYVAYNARYRWISAKRRDNMKDRKQKCNMQPTQTRAERPLHRNGRGTRDNQTATIGPRRRHYVALLDGVAAWRECSNILRSPYLSQLFIFDSVIEWRETADGSNNVIKYSEKINNFLINN